MIISVSNRLGNAAGSRSGWEQKDCKTGADYKKAFTHDWCPGIFRDGIRTVENFIESHCLYGDVDNTDDHVCTIEQFKEKFGDYNYIICTSKSHQKVKITGKDKKEYPALDRYHFIFPLDNPITDPYFLQDSLRAIIQKNPFCDKAVNDAARFFFGNAETEIYYNKGITFPIETLQLDTHKPQPILTDTENIPEHILQAINSKTGLEEVEADLSDILNIQENREKLFATLKEAAKTGHFDTWTDWYRLAVALKGAGFTVGDFISLSHEDAAGEAVRVWDGIKTVRMITKGTLVYYARMVKPRLFNRELKTLSKDAYEELKEKRNAEVKKEVAMLKHKGHISVLDKIVPDDLWLSEHCLYKETEKGVTITPKTTIQNIRIMLDFYGIKVRENLMRHDIEITIPGVDQDDTEGSKLNSDLAIVESTAVANGMNKNFIKNMLVSIAREEKYHPFREWIDNEVWDGQDRIGDYFNTLELADNYDSQFGLMLFRKWCLSQIGVIYEKHEPRARNVLTLQGPQNIGKTTFFRNLYPTGFFIEGLSLDPHNKDSIEKAISHVCCELGELEGVFRRDISALKAFLSSSRDSIRFAYTPRKEDFPRRTVFCATVNDQRFLIDPTGSSRFWIIRVSDVDQKFNADITFKKQFWRQAFEEYQEICAINDPYKYWLTYEQEQVLRENNEPHKEVDVYEDRILHYFNPQHEPCELLNCYEIARKIGIDNPAHRDAIGISRYLRNSGLFFEKHDKATRNKKWFMPRAKTDSVVNY